MRHVEASVLDDAEVLGAGIGLDAVVVDVFIGRNDPTRLMGWIGDIL